MSLTPELAILLVGSCVAASCALVGTYLVLRQMALLGDAISHAVLPGIALAFLLSGSRDPWLMVVGAGALGVVTVFLVEIGTRTGRLQEDASIGVVFPALFSIGVILIARYAGQVDLDLECVLYGEIAYAPYDLFYWQGRSIGPRALWINGTILGLVAAFVGVFYKELKLTTFDAGLAAALGFAPVLVHYLLMGVLSITVVGAFESVGAILVVAMLVVPPASAYLLTERLGRMLLLSVGFGVAAAWLGYGLAYWLDASIAGAMATVSGLLFALVFLVAPRHGLLAKLVRQRRLGRGLDEQLLLLHLATETESGAVPAPTADDLRDAPDPLGVVARRFSWRRHRLEHIARRLRRRGWLDRTADGRLVLTTEGATAIERTGYGPLRHPLGE